MIPVEARAREEEDTGDDAFTEEELASVVASASDRPPNWPHLSHMAHEFLESGAWDVARIQAEREIFREWLGTAVTNSPEREALYARAQALKDADRAIVTMANWRLDLG